MSAPARPRRSRGFTLLELLIAIAIFAVLALGTYRMLDSVLRTDESTRAQELRLRELTRAFAAFERDLAQTSPRPIRDAYGDRRAAFLGEEEAEDADLALELTRSGWRNPTGLARAQLQRVRWRLVDDRLERVYWVVLDQAVDSEPRVQKVLEGVEELQLRYLDRQGVWHNQWPPLPEGGSARTLELLPQALEFSLEHAGYGELIRLLRLPEGAPEKAAAAAEEGEEGEEGAEPEMDGQEAAEDGDRPAGEPGT